ncbi:MAG: metal ABC transporter permease [Aerococcus sp.]|nr:metal ABC transporter permease [Aerococcus sp.]
MAMFQYEFMQRALIACIAIAFFTPILGLFLILRRQSLMADTLSHVSLAGVALGYLIGVEPTITTMVTVILAAVLLEYLRKIYANYSDVSIALLMSGGMAVALMLLTRVETPNKVESFLFGSIVTITPLQVKLLIGLAVLIIALYVIFRRVLYMIAFDEATAYTAGLRTDWISMAISIITGAAIAIMMPIAGSLLVSAIIIMPAAIALRLFKNFNGVIISAGVIGILGMLGGLLGSYQWDTPPGATIIVIFILMFVIENLLLKVIKRA